MTLFFCFCCCSVLLCFPLDSTNERNLKIFILKLI
jgi:hypothetical protein